MQASSRDSMKNRGNLENTGDLEEAEERLINAQSNEDDSRQQPAGGRSLSASSEKKKEYRAINLNTLRNCYIDPFEQLDKSLYNSDQSLEM